MPDYIFALFHITAADAQKTNAERAAPQSRQVTPINKIYNWKRYQSIHVKVLILTSFSSQCFVTFSQHAEDSLVYSAPTFSKKKTGKRERRDVKAAEEEIIYSRVRALWKTNSTNKTPANTSRYRFYTLTDCFSGHIFSTVTLQCSWIFLLQYL